ncbi:hypothetical protein HPP92_014700 [Vanilla planifolia]|uniref:Uncharacterized protein n=1 Tax=Vanilla planifolia TaxID=51239 RepID=A0A835UTD3_VANPL|nr:hypothetical protein HPP92_014700 [Vanilla planifolia]
MMEKQMKQVRNYVKKRGEKESNLLLDEKEKKKEEEEEEEEEEEGNMKAYVSFGRIKTEKLGYSAALLSVLITITFVVLLMQGSSLRLPLLSLQVSIHTFVPKPAFMEESIVSYNKQVESKSKLIYVTQMANVKQGQNHINVSSLKQKHVVQSGDQERNYVIGSHSQEGNDILKVDSKSKLIYVTQMASVKQGQNHRNVSSLKQKHIVESSDQERNHVIGSHSQEENDTLKGVTDQTSSIICDFSESRSDTCYMLGDVRVLSSSSSILLVSTSSQPPSSSNNSSQSIKPYARKWEPQSMQNIKELHLRTSSKQQQSPDCNLKHTVPGIIFSTGGFLGNFFHDFTDVIIPSLSLLASIWVKSSSL